MSANFLPLLQHMASLWDIRASQFVQFLVGGILTLAASKLSEIYGPNIGALVWLFPILMTVSIIDQWYRGVPKYELAQLCFASFGTTLVNAVVGVLIGYLILSMPGSVWWPVLVAAALTLGIGIVYHKFFQAKH